MMRAASPATKLVAGVCAAGAICLAVITLASPSTTRMFAWPWTLAYTVVVFAAPLALAIRTTNRNRALVLPSAGWCWLGAGTAGAILASALLSPYRAQSVLWCAPLLAGIAVFFIGFDRLHGEPNNSDRRHAQLHHAITLAGLIVGSVSAVLWLDKLARFGVHYALASRNAYPFGHANYVAGFGVLILPVATALAARRTGVWRGVATVTAVLSLIMIFSSGSRGGLLGLAGVAAATLALSPWTLRKKTTVLAATLIGGLAFVVANPRTRATFIRGADQTLVAGSEIQRSAMAHAGAKMGADRPLLGWGPETTPLVYPRYRALLDGGPENVLQLHSLPVQIWAEMGLGGIACLIVGAVFWFRERQRDPIAAIALAGYAAFSLTDWQLDIPIFATVIGLLAASLARPRQIEPPRGAATTVGAMSVCAIAVVLLFGHRDPTPELNAQALLLAEQPQNADQAIALLRASLAAKPDQEIAHFNLGWLLVTRDPAAAERHFLAAAHLVPDKGGVYFGIGLARLNQGKSERAARAFALECLNDPAFLASPWWREPAIAATRKRAATTFAEFLSRPEIVRRRAPLDPTNLGRVPEGPERSYRRTRTGYPVLMRNLDLAAPLDLFVVREVATRDATTSANPLPPKGWLPAPVLLALLDEPDSAKL